MHVSTLGYASEPGAHYVTPLSGCVSCQLTFPLVTIPLTGVSRLRLGTVVKILAIHGDPGHPCVYETHMRRYLPPERRVFSLTLYSTSHHLKPANSSVQKRSINNGLFFQNTTCLICYR